ncbi:hypothetical protein [uncultured Porphyromonas sp.]|jgi:hypothetical protein|uniref:hypothetical protein n=1 Tax=uncultured Porphyromonas sp. TaxID=159274 RepID=UPI002624A654|nr:hypothetical protein [uncultured Porphyromonas sp.]
MKKVILIIVAVAVLALAYVTVQSVLAPVSFDKKQQEIELVLQKQLKKIATYEDAYKSVYDKYADKDELVNFLNNGRVFYIRAEGDYTSAMRDQGLSEEDAARRGLIRRDTIWVSAKDSLLKDGTDLAKLFSIPGSDSTIQVVAGTIEQEVGDNKVEVPVFQASASYQSYLGRLGNDRLVKEKIEKANSKANAFAGVRVGSLTEVKTNGNWE